MRGGGLCPAAICFHHHRPPVVVTACSDTTTSSLSHSPVPARHKAVAGQHTGTECSCSLQACIQQQRPRHRPEGLCKVGHEAHPWR
jgi:hypothetical protein